MSEDVPATGFSIGVSRLQAALAALGKLDGGDAAGPVVVLVMDRARIGDYQAMVAELRDADIAAELYLGDSGMKAQMKYADRRNAPLAIIQGGDEKARGVVQIKDLAVGKKLAAGDRRPRRSGARSAPARRRSPRPTWSRRSSACSAAASGVTRGARHRRTAASSRPSRASALAHPASRARDGA